jgi:outer membrane protein OmpA-like peptidoglycan-associated protein
VPRRRANSCKLRAFEDTEFPPNSAALKPKATLAISSISSRLKELAQTLNAVLGISMIVYLQVYKSLFSSLV